MDGLVLGIELHNGNISGPPGSQELSSLCRVPGCKLEGLNPALQRRDANFDICAMFKIYIYIYVCVI